MKMTRLSHRLLALLLALTMVLPMLPATALAGDDGQTTDWSQVTDFESGNTYYIGTAAELAQFRDLVNQKHTGEGATFLLTADIDMSSVCGPTAGEDGTELSWIPISYSSLVEGSFFAGDFNGNGKKLSDFYINSTDTGATNIALFGYVSSSARIRNLTVESGSVTIAGSYVSGIVGNANSCLIMNCINKADITSTNAVPGNMGGIVSSLGAGVIVNCANFGTISAPNMASTGKAGIGGLVGNGAAAIILNCYNAGEVSTTGLRAAGILGYTIKASIQNCYNIGSVTAAADSMQIAAIAVSSATRFPQLSLDNNYGLSSSALPGYALSNDTAAVFTDERYMEKSEDELKALANVLGTAYAADTLSLNNGYPVFDWQNTGVLPEPESKASISIADAAVVSNGTLSVTMSDTLAITKLLQDDFAVSATVNGEPVAGIAVTGFSYSGTDVVLTFTPFEYASSAYTASITITYNGGSSSKSIDYAVPASPYWKAYTQEPSVIRAGDKTYPDFAGYYKITSAEELAWFAGLANGTLSGVSRESGAYAFLANDI